MDGTGRTNGLFRAAHPPNLSLGGRPPFNGLTGGAPAPPAPPFLHVPFLFKDFICQRLHSSKAAWTDGTDGTGRDNGRDGTDERALPGGPPTQPESGGRPPFTGGAPAPPAPPVLHVPLLFKGFIVQRIYYSKTVWTDGTGRDGTGRDGTWTGRDNGRDNGQDE